MELSNQLHAPTLYTRQRTPIPIEWKDGWAPPDGLPGFRSHIVQLVA